MVNHPNRSKKPKWLPIETWRADASGVDETVLLSDGAIVFFGYCMGETWYDAVQDAGVPSFPTHWMPLPEPPLPDTGDK